MPSGEEGRKKWLKLAEDLRDVSWAAVHTCQPGKGLEEAPGCTACSLLLAAKNIVRDYKG